MLHLHMLTPIGSGTVPCARCFPEDDPSCPKGARIHPSSPRCYWLSEGTSPWPEARDACRETHGGDLASAGSPELQDFVRYSFPA